MAERARRAYNECETLVFGALVSAGRPVSAHRLAAILVEQQTPLWPNQVYRALNALHDRERVRRIEIMNAYLPVAENEELALVCSDCGEAATTHGKSILDALRDLAAAQGFRPSRIIVEAEGRCRHCSLASIIPAARPAPPRHRIAQVAASSD